MAVLKLQHRTGSPHAPVEDHSPRVSWNGGWVSKRGLVNSLLLLPLEAERSDQGVNSRVFSQSQTMVVALKFRAGAQPPPFPRSRGGSSAPVRDRRGSTAPRGWNGRSPACLRRLSSGTVLGNKIGRDIRFFESAFESASRSISTSIVLRPSMRSSSRTRSSSFFTSELPTTGSSESTAAAPPSLKSLRHR